MRARFLPVLVVVLLVALPLGAQSNEVGLWYAMSQVGDTNVEDSSVNFDDGDGFGVSFNHFWTNKLSTEVSAVHLHSDGVIALDGANTFDIGELVLTPVTATVQWHFGRRE